MIGCGVPCAIGTAGDTAVLLIAWGSEGLATTRRGGPPAGLLGRDGAGALSTTGSRWAAVARICLAWTGPVGPKTSVVVGSEPPRPADHPPKAITTLTAKSESAAAATSETLTRID